MEDPITRPVLAAGFFVGDTPHLAVGAQKLFNRLQDRSPASLSSPRWCPVFAFPGQMLTVLEQAPAECAAQQRVAVLIQSVGEVLARHANPCSPEGGESPLVYPGPFLHRSSASTDVLTPVR